MNLCYDLDTYGKNGQKTFQMHDYPNYDHPEWNDNVESWWCGKNLKYTFCVNVDDDCSGDLGQSGAGNIRTGAIGHPNTLDKVKLQYYDPLEIGAVTAFMDSDCHNWAGRFDAAADPKETAYYNTDDIEKRHLKDDAISSVAIPQGYTVKLYNENGFDESNKLVLNGPMWTDSEHSMSCINLVALGWNDMVSSIGVYRTNLGATAQGKWVGQTATESIDFTYHVGLSSSVSTAKKEGMSFSLIQDMSMGIEFEGEGVSTEISSMYATDIETDVTTVYDESISEDQHISCTGGVGKEESVGLWQWVVSSSDETVLAKSKHTICKYGTNYNQAPKCPENACTNYDCSECHDDWEA